MMGLQQQKEMQQKEMKTCHALLESDLLQLLRRSRLQLEQLQHKRDTDTSCAVLSNTSNSSSSRKRANILSWECATRSAASCASLLQNVHTLSLLQQQLHQQLKRQQQQQPEASAPAAAAAAIAAFVQEIRQFCNDNNGQGSGIRRPLPLQLPKKRVYWQQQHQQQVLLKLVDQALVDIELWAEEVPSDCEAAAPPIPVQPAATEQQQGRQQHVCAVERRQMLLLEDRGNRELLLQHSGNPGVGTSAAAAPTGAPAAAELPESQLEEHLLDTASEMKQGALMFRERLQKDNILLQRTAATQEALQQQQQRGLDAAKKLLRFTFFFALMPLVQLAIALAVTLAMISFIFVTPG